MRVDNGLYKPTMSGCLTKKFPSGPRIFPIEILVRECVLCHVIGVQNENKSALINPPSWIFPRSVVYKRSWGELNLHADLPL